MNTADNITTGVDPTSRLRVLQLVNSLDVGGLEQVVVDLTRGLSTVGVDCFVACLSHAGTKFPDAAAVGTWVGDLQHRQPRFISWRTLTDLCYYIRRQRIQMIHSHNPTAHLYGSFAALLTGCPQIHTVHGRGSPTVRHPERRAWLRRQLTRLTHRIVAVSEDVQHKLLSADRVPASKTVTILNGIDTDAVRGVTAEARQCLRRERNIPCEAFVVGSVGRLAVEKNYPLLVEAFARLRQEVPTAFLVIVGDGAAHTQIETAIRQAGVEKGCLLAGMRRDPIQWLQCFDIFCLSSDTEGTSVSALEAMACGLPVVATDVGGNREIVRPPECGLIVFARDPQALTEAYSRLLRDPLIRDCMGVAGRARVIQHFSLQQMVRQYAELYEELLTQKQILTAGNARW